MAEPPTWDRCYSPINLFSFLNYMTFVATPVEAQAFLHLAIRLHQDDYDCGWEPVKLLIPSEDSSRKMISVPFEQCSEAQCWRCEARQGGWAFQWQHERWTPRCALLAAHWDDGSTDEKVRLKQLSWDIANALKWPIGPHKAPAHGADNVGWSTGAEGLGTEFCFMKNGHPIMLKITDRPRRIGNDSSSRQAAKYSCVVFPGLDGGPRPAA
jgi:hypothetical protein